MPVKPFDKYDAGDVQALIDGQVPEGRTLDYKRELPGTSNDDKKEFLADVSSFANTAGGELIFGIDEEGGVPTAIVGVASDDYDHVIRRLDDMIRSGVQPRVRVHLRVIMSVANQAVVWIRIDQSWDAPHRVTFSGWDKFFGRNSAGKYQLDITELRHVFQRTSGAVEAVEKFKDARVAEIQVDRGPVALGRRPKVLVHLIPLDAFARKPTFDVVGLANWESRVQPLSRLGWSGRITMNGALGFAIVETMPVSYAHLYRSGVVEFADSATLGLPGTKYPSIPSQEFEDRVIHAVDRGIALQRDLGVQPPVYCFITLVHAAGMTLGISDDYSISTDRIPLSEKALSLPEAFFDSFDDPTAPTLRPSVDVLWNAFGHERSPNFADDGTWRPR